MIDGGGGGDGGLGGRGVTPSLHTHAHTHTPRHAPASMSGTHFGFLDRVTTEAIADYL